MNKSVFAFAALLALLLCTAQAQALSEDNSRGMNADGTAKFADPDGQSPSGMPLPSPDGRPLPFDGGQGMQMAPGGMGLSVFGGNSAGPDAFDRNYMRQGDNK